MPDRLQTHFHELFFFFFSSRRRHTRCSRDWSSDVCSSDLTTRFRAAAAGAGIANWQSYYGENQIDQWMIPFFGASVYEDPSVYARSSPINYIDRKSVV